MNKKFVYQVGNNNKSYNTRMMHGQPNIKIRIKHVNHSITFIICVFYSVLYHFDLHSFIPFHSSQMFFSLFLSTSAIKEYPGGCRRSKR